MRCPACGHENPEGAKFCNECAAKIELTCPRCNKINPPESKFCNECGTNLSAPPGTVPKATGRQPAPSSVGSGEILAKVQRYLPQGWLRKFCPSETGSRGSGDR